MTPLLVVETGFPQLAYMYLWVPAHQQFGVNDSGVQWAKELFVAMEWLKPIEDDLWFQWQFFSHLKDWVQRQLA